MASVIPCRAVTITGAPGERPPRAQIAQRVPMRATQVGHVNVITNAAAVWFRVIRTENFNLGSLP
jgi:hypothetical protein